MPPDRSKQSSNPDATKSSEFRLEPIERKPNQYLKQPLPQQDREEIESRIAKLHGSRLSLLEAMVAVTMVCILLGIANFIRFDFYTVGLGLTALAVLMGALDFALSERQRNLSIVILLVAYCTASTWTVAKVEGWFSQ